MAEAKGSVTLKFDYRWVVTALVLVIVIMTALWRPWEPRYDKDARTVDATGTAMVKAVPDQFAFYPVYTFKNADKTSAINASNAKSKEVVDGLKKLSVADSAIKTSVNGYQDGMYNANSSSDGYVYSLSVTVTLTDKDLAQKVQDYLVTTAPEGGVSPQPTFSEAKRKVLESEARDNATKDAKSKAEQMAKNLGGRIGDVKSISDGNGFGSGPMPFATIDGMKSTVAEPALALQPGENELTYSVKVVYYLR